MQLKTTEVEGVKYADIKDGKPIYLDDKGGEHSFDAPAMRVTIDGPNGLAASLKAARTEAATASETAKAFEGIDPEAARSALEMVSNLDAKKLVDAGEIAKVKEEARKVFQKQLDEATDKNEALETRYADEKIGNVFGGSKFIKENLTIPPDMARGTFGAFFKYTDGRVVPQNTDGTPIYSLTSPGEVATFDEAMAIIVSGYANRDLILKGSGSKGSGADELDPDGSGKRVIKRDAFFRLSPKDQSKYATDPDVKIID